ncbi:MAG: hypothetical protein SCK28_04025 [Bacillota bacterium]|nr:hypothetical protein [Bacillota bacterium]
MRQWRVGSLSMGLTLIALGIVMLASLLKGYTIIEQLLNWWPIILIVLGVEVIGYLYFSKQEQPSIKYDFLSIFVILSLGFLSIGVYTVASIGIIPRVTSMMASNNYAVMLPDTEIAVTSDINNIVIEAPAMPLELKSGTAESITLFGKGVFVTTSEDEAQEMAAKSGIKAKQVGDTLYVYFEEITRWGDLTMGVRDLNYTLVLPEGKQVEVKRSQGYSSLLTFDGAAVTANWRIDGVGRIRVNVDKDTNLAITANTYRQGLRGNVEWQVTELKEGEVTGNIVFGEGQNFLSILRGQEIEVNLHN